VRVTGRLAHPATGCRLKPAVRRHGSRSAGLRDCQLPPLSAINCTPSRRAMARPRTASHRAALASKYQRRRTCRATACGPTMSRPHGWPGRRKRRSCARRVTRSRQWCAATSGPGTCFSVTRCGLWAFEKGGLEVSWLPSSPERWRYRSLALAWCRAFTSAWCDRRGRKRYPKDASYERACQDSTSRAEPGASPILHAFPAAAVP